MPEKLDSPEGSNRKTLGQIIVTAVLTAVLSGSVFAAVVGVFAKGYVTEVETTVRSLRAHKEQAYASLFAPIHIHFDRSCRGFQRYNDTNKYLEAKVLKAANEAALALLLQNAHLAPPALISDIGNLVAHYDVWLEYYHSVRGERDLTDDAPFVFVADKGVPFPTESEKRLWEHYVVLWKELGYSSQSDGETPEFIPCLQRQYENAGVGPPP
jgi:hypothetical protein